MERPDTRYTWSGDFTIAYQVLGEGPSNLVYLPGYMANVEANWQVPPLAAFLEDLASFCRLVVMDRRGEGCSDRLPPGQAASLEEMVDDVIAVTEAAMCEGGTHLLGVSDSGFVTMLAAAAHPDLFAGLILFGAAPTWRRSDDMPWMWSDDQWAAQIARYRRTTSARELGAAYVRAALPSLAGDRELAREIGSLIAQTEGMGAVLEDLRRFSESDVRQVLPAISVPTLVLHRTTDVVEPVESGRYLAELIPGARIVELPGSDAQPWAGDSRAVVEEIREFVTGVRGEPEPVRRLVTVLITDIVGSTERAAASGDASWRDAVEAHDQLAHAIVGEHRGEFVRGTGDGFVATFDGPARAVRCAHAVVGAVKPLGIDIRAGVHTGEVAYGGNDLAGIAVHIAARVAAMAGSNEVWASSTVKDLTAGSGLVFEDRREHELKGVPDRWHLYRVVA